MPDIFELGFNKLISREVPLMLEGTDLGMASSVGNVFTGGSPSNLASGELLGNLTIKDGYIQSGNYVEGISGWQLTPTTAQLPDLTIVGGTIRYGKTSFTDSTNAGYYMGSEGIYFGAAADASKLKYTIGDGTFDFIGTVSGRSTLTLANSINASGQLVTDIINARLDTSAKQILDGFTFGVSGAIQIGTYEAGVSGDVKISPAGIVGRNKSNENTFALNAATGEITAIKLVGASGEIGGWTIGATDLSAASGGNTTILSSGATAFSAGPTGSPTVTITQAGVISATGAVIDGTSTIGGRTASTLASAIDASGHFIDSALNTSAKTILGDFTFGESGAIKMITDADNGLWISPTGILGKTAGENTFTIGTDGSAYFAGTFAAGLIIAADISTGLYTQIDANLPSDENLVGYWNFDEGKGLVANDDSGNGNNGTLIGSMTDADWVAGVVGTALDFDGTNDRVEAIDTGITTPQEMSISAWFKRNASDSVGGIAGFTHEAFNFSIDSDTTGRVNSRRSNNLDGKLSGRFGVTMPSLGTSWHHIVFTQTTDYTIKPKFYLDGVEYTPGSPAYYDVVVTDDFVIGEVNVGGAGCFLGKIDEVRLYNKVLTAKEAYALYKNPAGNKGVMIPTGRLTSGSIYSKQITLAVAAGTGDSYIAAGKDDFTNTDSGFILGIDDSDADKAKFYIGDATYHLNWDGTKLTVNDTDLSVQPIYGNGADGDVNINSGTFSSGPITSNVLTRDAYFDNLTLSGGNLDCGGYRLFVKNTLTINSGYKIHRNGNNGGNASGATGGSAGTAPSSNSIYGGLAGVVGATGKSTAGSGDAGNSGSNQVQALGSNGVVGGAGGTIFYAPVWYYGGAGGGGGTITSAKSKPYSLPSCIQMVETLEDTVKFLKGSAGGGSGGAGGIAVSGGGAYSGGGGGSGSSGGMVVIVSRKLVNNGTIEAKGGNGGNGGNANAAGNEITGSCGGGGGAGGNGGVMVLLYLSKSGAGTTSVTGGTKGTGGLGDGPGGANGADGNDGSTGNLFDLQF